MSLAAFVPVQSPIQRPHAPDLGRLLDTFFAGRNERTLAAYRADLETFRSFVEVATTGDAARWLLSISHGEANGIALAYKAHMTDRGLHAATINRRLAALRSLVVIGNTLGLVPWKLTVENAKTQAYRDTRGPGLDGFKSILAAASAQQGAKGCRDVALLHLMHDLGLRRGEVVRLDVSDVDLPGSRLSILGKARSQKEFVTLPAPTMAALSAWLEVRGTYEGPLFINFDRARKGSGRLTGAAVYHLVRKLGAASGFVVRPHGLRHLAITTALDVTNGDMRAVQKFSRHRDVRVLNTYDDNRDDLAGKVASLVAGR